MSEWHFYRWRTEGKAALDQIQLPLQVEKLLITNPIGLTPDGKPERNPLSVEGLIYYGDTAYLAARILMLAGESVHPESLYCVAQTIEKYMKAILLSKLGENRYRLVRRSFGNGHQLARIAKSVVTECGLGEFGDSEFLRLCQTLEPFEEAGRYPDHQFKGWGYTLDLLTFLDGFIVHSRKHVIVPAGTVNVLNQFKRQNIGGNPVMLAALKAYRDNNRELTWLEAWPG